MNKFKKWMIAVDLNKSPINLLNNISKLANRFTPSEIHLVYVRNELDIPKEVFADIPDLLVPDTKSIQTRLEKIAERYFHPNQLIHAHILSGNQLTELLKFEDQYNVDLAILGKRDTNSVGILATKMVRKSSCNVLLIPERIIEEVKSILLPLDFSEYSDLAVDVLNDFENHGFVPNVHALYVYKDASKYLNQVFETLDEIDEILSKRGEINERLSAYAKHLLDDYLIKKDKPLIEQRTLSIERGQNIGEPIDKLIEELKPDLLIMGSKGKTMSATSLLGEVSESMLSYTGNHLNLILKKTGENQGFLRSLLNLGR